MEVSPIEETAGGRDVFSTDVKVELWKDEFFVSKQVVADVFDEMDVIVEQKSVFAVVCRMSDTVIVFGFVFLLQY